jgi:hypothetical protein
MAKNETFANRARRHPKRVIAAFTAAAALAGCGAEKDTTNSPIATNGNTAVVVDSSGQNPNQSQTSIQSTESQHSDICEIAPGYGGAVPAIDGSKTAEEDILGFPVAIEQANGDKGALKAGIESGKLVIHDGYDDSAPVINPGDHPRTNSLFIESNC